jgi:methionyl-tRNA synthetase
VPRRFYITTAIDYVNGRPHLGHAYEKVLADALARVHRQRGDATWFLTGTDEHGQKISRAAEAAGKAPQAFVDEMSQTFVSAWKALGVVYDQFIRTSDRRHGHAVQELMRRLSQAHTPRSGAPAIYEGEYVGLYCEGCEGFKSEKELDSKGRCPEHKRKPKEIRESNFFFRLSEYDQALLRHIEAHPDFIQPDYRRAEVVNVIRGGLEDVSVSRPNLTWGIPLPDEIPGGAGHTVYVWPDALLNYLSALGWPQRTYCKWWLAKEGETGGPGATRQDEFQELDGQGRPGAAWAGTGQPLYTNGFHLIGKDISRFHCVLWPAMLLAAGVPLPRQVYVHGFILLRKPDAKGAGAGAQVKMSKSLGNVVDPVELAGRVGADALRFYLIDAIPTGGDGEFSPELFVEHCNTHLANKLGNLASRTVKLVHNGYAGRTPPEWEPGSFRDDAVREAFAALTAAATAAAAEVPKAYEELRLHDALASAWRPVERANEFVDRSRPWDLAKDPARRAELGTALNVLLETLRLVAIWAWPVLPAKCEQLWSVLGLPGSPAEARGPAAAPAFGAPAERALGAPVILFPRLDVRTVLGAPPPASPAGEAGAPPKPGA